MWRVEYTKRFLKELASLPKDVQQQVEMVVFQELNSTNPFELGYLEKMTGYPDKYKVRLGDYRIGVTMDTAVFIRVERLSQAFAHIYA